MFGLFGKKDIDCLNGQICGLQKDIVRLNEELKKKDYFLNTLFQLNEDIADFEQSSLLEKSLDILTKLMNAYSGIIFLEESGYFSAKGFKNTDPAPLKDFKISQDDDLLKIINEAKGPITISELGKKFDIANKEHFKILNIINPEVISPLVFKNKLIGFISLNGHQGSTVFSEEGLRLLKSVSSQIAVAIFNIRLNTNLEVSNKELYSKMFELINLHRMSDAISSVLDLDRIKQLTIDMFAEVIGSQKAILFLKDDGRKKFIPVSWRGLKEEDCRDIDFEFDSQLLNHFVDSKKVLQLDISKIRETFLQFNCSAVVSTALARQDLFLYIPFFSNEKLVALLALGKSISKKEITPHEIESLTMLSSLAAVTIDNANLYKLSVQDGLTGVFIHRYFQQSLEYKLTAGLEHMNRRVVTLFMVDIDFFKNINDLHGHPAGDQILKDVARIIVDNVRIVDTVARYGGEEFAVIIPEIDLKESSIMAERIRKSIESFKFSDGAAPIKITVSLGVATYPDYARNKDELIKQADLALYKSKQEGRNKVTLCSELQDNPAKSS